MFLNRMNFTGAQIESAIIEFHGADDYPYVIGEAIGLNPKTILVKRRNTSPPKLIFGKFTKNSYMEE